MFWIKEMGKYAGSMRTRALSGAETIHVNGEVLEYLIQGNQHGYCVVHTPQCRTYGTMPYAVCRMKYAVREHASSLFSYGIRHGIQHIHCDSMKYDLMLHWITMNIPYPVPYPVWKCLPYGSTNPPYYKPTNAWQCICTRITTNWVANVTGYG